MFTLDTRHSIKQSDVIVTNLKHQKCQIVWSCLPTSSDLCGFYN